MIVKLNKEYFVGSEITCYVNLKKISLIQVIDKNTINLFLDSGDSVTLTERGYIKILEWLRRNDIYRLMI